MSLSNALKSDLKKPRICPISGQSDPLWSQTYHPWCRAIDPRVTCRRIKTDGISSMPGRAIKLDIFATNGTIMGLFFYQGQYILLLYQISFLYIFRQNVLKLIWKSPKFVPFREQSAPLWSRPWHRWCICCLINIYEISTQLTSYRLPCRYRYWVLLNTYILHGICLSLCVCLSVCLRVLSFMSMHVWWAVLCNCFCRTQSWSPTSFLSWCHCRLALTHPTPLNFCVIVRLLNLPV